MQAVIMAGGFGTRLRPLTNNIPKPMIPMANRPMMEHIVELVRAHGMTRLVTLLYFQPEVIERHFADGAEFGVEMTYLTATEDFGTAGAVKFAAPYLKEPFLVISGDVLTDFDLTQAIAFHRARGARATIVLTRVENPLQYGLVITDDEGRITRFLEKPTWSEVFTDTVNTGIYILEPEVLEFIPPGVEVDFSRDLFPLLMREEKALYGYVAAGYWRDVGDLIEYRLAHRDILAGAVRVNVPGSRVEGIDRAIWLGEGSRVDFTAALRGAVFIGRHARVEANTRIINSVIGDRCVIQEGASISDSVLWADVHVGRGATLSENVVGTGSEIRARARLFEGALIADHCRIGEESVVKADVKVWPQKVVEEGATLSTSLVWGSKWSRAIFGAYGVTGLANAEISPEFAAKLGACFGATLREGAIVRTSRDPHRSSRMINRALICGLLSAGVDVHDLRVTPIPLVRYKMGAQGASAGTHVRRSPFDPQLVDIKFFDERGLNISSNRERSVERLFFREDFRRAGVESVGRLSFPEYDVEYYLDGVRRFVEAAALKARRLKVVVDYAYGTAVTVFPSLLGELGCEVIALNAYIDEARLTKTEEEFRHALHQLSEIVRTLGADLGVLMDAGAEKIFLVDDKGDLIPDDLALCLFTLLVLRTQPKGAIGVPVTASGALDDLAQSFRAPLVRTKLAQRALMETAARDDVAFVGDGMGGYIFPHFQPAFDGMLATLKLLEMLAREGDRVHQLVRQIPQRFAVREQVSCPWERKGAVMRRLLEATREERRDLTDGVKLFLGEDWVALFPDQDRAAFHVVADASSRGRAEAMASKYRDLVRGWIAEE
ncbi:MAG TPA: mannose-1-phosphate guanyltransferase [Candidatus Methylomirabilis sp.]